MKKLFVIIAVCLSSVTFAQEPSFRLVIHGGAGTILRKNLTPELEKAYRDKLEEALKAGYDILSKGGASTEAVIAAINVMEDCPLFNAGKGAVFTNEGSNELDASIMEGKTLKAGAVAGVTTVKNPINAAYAVMTKSEHVLLAGSGADAFAKAQGLEIVDPSYFKTEERWNQLLKVRDSDKMELEHDGAKKTGALNNADIDPFIKDRKFGTVGAIALDKNGNLAAGTSTGGMTNKRFGRVGDAPIIGAGTYADNESVAVSATGTGEMFIRTVAAYQIAARVKLNGESIAEATENVLKEIVKINGRGGIIVLNAKGEYYAGMTEGMYRGTIGADGKPSTAIFGTDTF